MQLSDDGMWASAQGRLRSMLNPDIYNLWFVNNNGKTVYCREQLMTGSHMRKEIICLTKAELEIAREASRRNLEQMQKRVPPPRGT
jgi:hypothetical protein